MESSNGYQKNKLGHIHEGRKTEEGYGLCSYCGARENTDAYASGCLKEGYYIFINPSVGITDKSRIFIQVDSDGQKWVDWCEPSIQATKLNELLPGGIFESCS